MAQWLDLLLFMLPLPFFVAGCTVAAPFEPSRFEPFGHCGALLIPSLYTVYVITASCLFAESESHSGVFEA